MRTFDYHAEKPLNEEKGQALIMDFAVALMLFILMWFFITAEFNTRFADAANAQAINSMHLKAGYILETLVKTPGVPQDWESLQAEDVNSIGLAIRDRDVSEGKLAAFSDFNGTYDELRQKLGIGNADFYFTFAYRDMYTTAGMQPMGSADKVAVQRIVMYKGEDAIATLMLYRLQ